MRFYSSKAWQRLRLRQLLYAPLCGWCGAPATVADHIKPIEQGGAVFDCDNLQSLCERCHNRKRATHDKGKQAPKLKGCDKNGLPLDAAHWWSVKKVANK